MLKGKYLCKYLQTKKKIAQNTSILLKASRNCHWSCSIPQRLNYQLASLCTTSGGSNRKSFRGIVHYAKCSDLNYRESAAMPQHKQQSHLSGIILTRLVFNYGNNNDLLCAPIRYFVRSLLNVTHPPRQTWQLIEHEAVDSSDSSVYLLPRMKGVKTMEWN